MKEFTFENQNTNTYLVYEVSADDDVDSMSLGMLKNNKIPGIASVVYTQMDTVKYMKYNVSAKISVKEFFSRPVNKKKLLGVFGGIITALLSAEDYMIDMNKIILDLEYIFTDVSSCETILICLPVQSAAHEYDLGAFFKEIMFNTQFDQTEDCDYVARVINYLNSTPFFSLIEFKQLMDGIREEKNIGNIEPAPQQRSESNMIQSKMVTPQQQKPIGDEKINNPAFPVLGMNVPNSTPVPVVANKLPVMPNQPVSDNKEKKMSMLNLLMHYSKENAEIYKAQKAEKKKAKVSDVPSASKNTGKIPTAKKQQQVGFDIPEVPSAGRGFEIPRQSAQQSVPPMAQYVNVPKDVILPQMSSDTPDNKPRRERADFGETMVITGGAIGETIVLNPSNNPLKEVTPYLVRKKNNEKIPLNKPIFRIGKEKSFVDYCIGDNKTVSRSHANFISRDGEFYVVDTNSTNHTYVNGEMIRSNMETPIYPGDKIMLANEDFEFKLG